MRAGPGILVESGGEAPDPFRSRHPAPLVRADRSASRGQGRVLWCVKAETVCLRTEHDALTCRLEGNIFISKAAAKHRTCERGGGGGADICIHFKLVDELGMGQKRRQGGSLQNQKLKSMNLTPHQQALRGHGCPCQSSDSPRC